MKQLLIVIGTLLTFTAFAKTDIAILESFLSHLESDYNTTNGRILELQEELKAEESKLQNITCELVNTKNQLGLDIKNPAQAMKLCPRDFTAGI